MSCWRLSSAVLACCPPLLLSCAEGGGVADELAQSARGDEDGGPGFGSGGRAEVAGNAKNGSAAGGQDSSGPGWGAGGSSPGGPTRATGGVEGVGGSFLGSGGLVNGTGGRSVGDLGGGHCAELAEGEGTRLVCPEGQVIERVIFASYGTPSGSCGAFALGSCHAEGSQERVETLCLGRAACTIRASNSSFGDPCNQTEKSLSVEVECAPGEPIVVPEPFKGLANSPANEIAETGASWCYNWTTQPQANDCGDPLFVPMIWGAGDVASAIAGIKRAGYDTVLGFNEPNKSDQANMSVEEAIALWPALTSEPSIRVGSPAVSDDGRAWLEEFMDHVEAQGLRVDFIAMHWYGWNEGSCTAGNLKGAINWASQWGLPVWITEFGCMGSSNPDEATLLKFFDDSVALLEGELQVERYAWYPWNTHNHIYLPDGDEIRQRTALGDAFAAAPSTR